MTKPKKDQVKAYKEMAKTSPDSMKAKIEANLMATCDKYAGHEDLLDDCINYLTDCAREILNSKSGDVPDEVSFRICRDYFNDEVWKAEEEAKAKHAAEAAEAKKKEADRKVKLARRTAAKEKKENFEKVVGEWIRKKVRKNCMVVSVPADIQAVRVQAKKLHQCLESCDYIGKMAKRKCLLVFITTKEGAPVATAEILPSGKVGQFYGDEAVRDMKKMKPGKKAQEALDAWLKKFKPRWRKAA